MNILIDTHILLWYMTEYLRLKAKYKEQIENEGNNLFVSKTSLWEITIKVSLGKLKIEKPISEFENYFKEKSFNEFDFDHRDLDTLSKLPFYHGDPFDRLIISQAINRNLIVISDDPKFKLYPVQLFQ
ncbi:MAG: type II toxin-antitoxin system VapC family toxin [Cytophagales bacterium]